MNCTKSMFGIFAPITYICLSEEHHDHPDCCLVWRQAVAVWATNELGVWGDAKKGEQTYNKLVTGQLNVKSLVPAAALEYVPTFIMPYTLHSILLIRLPRHMDKT